MIWIFGIVVVLLLIVIYGHKQTMENLADRIDVLEDKVFPNGTDND